MKIKQLNDKAILPRYGTEGAGAFDLYCYEDVDWKNVCGTHYAEVYTGWAMQVPQGNVLKLYPRSGLARKHTIKLTNGTGIIDSDYRGEVIVLLKCNLNVPPIIKAGTAIAQGIVVEAPRIYFHIVEKLSETIRGDGGFGSTDKEK